MLFKQRDRQLFKKKEASPQKVISIPFIPEQACACVDRCRDLVLFVIPAEHVPAKLVPAHAGGRNPGPSLFHSLSSSSFLSSQESSTKKDFYQDKPRFLLSQE